MEAKVNTLIQNPSFLKNTTKTLNLDKNKDFSSTLKSSGQDNKEKDKFENKYLKVIVNKDSQKTNKEDNINNKRQTKDIEEPVEKDDQTDKDIDYKINYTLFNNVLQNTIQNEDDKESVDLDLNLNQDDIKVLDLESLAQTNIDEINREILDDEDLLEKTYNLQSNNFKNKETLVDEEDLVKYPNAKINVYENQSRKNKEERKMLKVNNNTNVDDSKEALGKENNQSLELEDLFKEDTRNYNKNIKPKEFKLEDNSAKQAEEDFNIKDKVDFTFERQEIKLTNTDNIETKNQEPIDKKQFMEHIIEKVKLDFSSSKNQIKLTLKPESLGDMIMEVEVVKNSLVAKIMVDNQRAKEIIENNLFQLKEGVKDSGLEIKTFEVFVGNNSDFDKHNSNEFNFNGRNKKVKIKGENKNKKMGLYEENIKVEKTNLLNLYSESSLNLFA